MKTQIYFNERAYNEQVSNYKEAQKTAQGFVDTVINLIYETVPKPQAKKAINKLNKDNLNLMRAFNQTPFGF
jgi:hypothetical protein